MTDPKIAKERTYKRAQYRDGSGPGEMCPEKRMVSAGEKKGCLAVLGWEVTLSPNEQVGSGGQEPGFKSTRAYWLRLMYYDFLRA